MDCVYLHDNGEMMNMNELPWTRVKRLKRSEAVAPLQALRDCPLCHTSSEDELFALHDFQFFTDQEGRNRADHRVVHCRQCGLIYTNPCYTPAGFQVLFDKAGCSYGHTAGRIGEQVAWLSERFPAARSLMDVGCGNGDLLKALPDSLSRHGIDIDEQTLNRVAQSAPGINFSVCDFNGLKRLPQVDVITLFHVLEHLPDPDGFLAQLRTLSKSSASLVIEVPVVDRAAELQDRDIVGFFSIQHLTHFSKLSLQRMLAKNGWRVVHAEAMAGYNGWRVVAEHGPAHTDVGCDGSGIVAARAYLDVWKSNVEAVRSRIEKLKGARQIMIWGAGQHTEYLALLTRLFNMDAGFIVVDSDPMKQGHHYHSLPVLSPSQVSAQEWQEGIFPIVISTYGGQESLLKVLKEKGVDESRIIALYDRTSRY
jgi:2-polyprenyl-3-methyl-5-hydroxy-6-metoxy-1,4-benzoquinol methylase